MTTARNRKQARADRRRARGTQLDLVPRTEPKKKATTKKAAPRKVRYAPRRRGPEHFDGLVDYRDQWNYRSVTPVFVYGTLKTGYGLASSLPHARIPVVARGRVYARSGHLPGAYPVMDFRESGWVKGELVMVPNTRANRAELDSVLRMEEGAGYVVGDAEVILPNGTPMLAVACRWEKRQRGERVPGAVHNVVAGDRVEDAAEWSRPDRFDDWFDDDDFGDLEPEPTRPAPRSTRWFDGPPMTDEPGPGLVEPEWTGTDGSCLLCDAFQGHDPACPIGHGLAG